MLRRIRPAVTAALVVASVLIFNGGGAYAQSTNKIGNGMRISPVRSDLTIPAGTSKTVDVYLSNITNDTSNLKAAINDFEASKDETGTPHILLNGDDSATSHGLKKFIDKIDNFTLAPKEEKHITVTISIPKGTPGGGYYGAVRFLPTSVDESKNLSLSASVGTLMLVTVPGGVTEQASIVSLNVAKGKDGKASNMFTNGSGLQATVRIRNGGNVQVAPFGKILLKKGSKVLGSFEVNDTQPRGSVLPDSVRKFSVDFGNKAKTLGKYTVEGNFGYGEKGQLMTARETFIVIPLPIIITVAASLLVIILGLILVPRYMKSHDRRLVRKVRRNG